jgi:hypothetical protein
MRQPFWHKSQHTYFTPQVRESVINMLSSTEMDDLPVVVKFILQSVADNEAFEVNSYFLL